MLDQRRTVRAPRRFGSTGDTTERWAPLVRGGSAALPSLVAVSPLLVLLVQQLLLPPDDGVPWADWAALELATRAVFSGDQLTGAYSHFGFSHPGPFMFFWMAPFYALAGGRFDGLVLGMLTFHVTCLAAVVLVGQRVFGRVEAWLAAFVVLVFTWRFGLANFRDPWNPFWVVAPLALLVLSAIGTWRLPHRWPLVLAVASASVAIQSHVGTTAAALAVLAVAVVGTVWVHRGAERRWRTTLWPALVTGGVLWLAPAVEQVTSNPGNVGLLVRYWCDNRTSHPLELVDAPSLAALAWGPSPFPLGEEYGSSSPFLEPPIAVGMTDRVVAVAGALILLGGAALALRRPRDAALALVGLVPVGAVVLQTAASTSLRDVGSPYQFMPMIGIALGWWICCALYVGGAGRLVVRALVDDPVWRTRLRRVAPLAVVAVAVAVLCSARPQLDATSVPFGESHPSRAVEAMLDATERYCDAGQRVWIRSDEGAWFVTAALGAGLERCGARVTFGEELAYLVGPRYEQATPPAGAVELAVVMSDVTKRPSGDRVRRVDVEGFALDVDSSSVRRDEAVTRPSSRTRRP